MKYGYVIKTLALCCFAFLFVYCGFLTSNYLKSKPIKSKEEIKENDYYKKISMNKSNLKGSFDHFTRVEISIRDDGFTPKGRIVDVCLNEEKLPLKPADSRSRRGSTIVQLRPNTYTIKWIVQNNCNPPTYEEYKKEIHVTDMDLWIHVHIEGSKITFS